MFLHNLFVLLSSCFLVSLVFMLHVFCLTCFCFFVFRFVLFCFQFCFILFYIKIKIKIEIYKKYKNNVYVYTGICVP